MAAMEMFRISVTAMVRVGVRGRVRARVSEPV